MKCPFRTDEKGEFMECYEKDCMAFVEAKFPAYTYSDPFSCGIATTEENMNYVYTCKRMNPPPVIAPYRGCV